MVKLPTASHPNTPRGQTTRTRPQPESRQP